MSNSQERVTSRWAMIAGRIGQASIVCALLGAAGARVGLLTPMNGFQLFLAGAVLGGGLSLLLGLVGLALTRGGDAIGRSRAWTGVGSALVLVAVVVVSVAPGAGLPKINDISTDLVDPPAFGAAKNEPENRGRDMQYPTEFISQVREAYPDLEPMAVAAAPDRAFESALAGARSLGWEISWADPSIGAFEAREVSGLFRFVDDIRVRVRPSEAGSVVDIRSKSRDGRGDLGANASRIRAFIAALSNSQEPT